MGGSEVPTRPPAVGDEALQHWIDRVRTSLAGFVGCFVRVLFRVLRVCDLGVKGLGFGGGGGGRIHEVS